MEMSCRSHGFDAEDVESMAGAQAGSRWREVTQADQSDVVRQLEERADGPLPGRFRKIEERSRQGTWAIRRIQNRLTQPDIPVAGRKYFRIWLGRWFSKQHRPKQAIIDELNH